MRHIYPQPLPKSTEEFFRKIFKKLKCIKFFYCGMKIGTKFSNLFLSIQQLCIYYNRRIENENQRKKIYEFLSYLSWATGRPTARRVCDDCFFNHPFNIDVVSYQSAYIIRKWMIILWVSVLNLIFFNCLSYERSQWTDLASADIILCSQIMFWFGTERNKNIDSHQNNDVAENIFCFWKFNFMNWCLIEHEKKSRKKWKFDGCITFFFC